MNNMSPEQILLFAIVISVISMIIWYNIIKMAVSSANKPLEEKLQRLIELQEAKINQ